MLLNPNIFFIKIKRFRVYVLYNPLYFLSFYVNPTRSFLEGNTLKLNENETLA